MQIICLVRVGAQRVDLLLQPLPCWQPDLFLCFAGSGKLLLGKIVYLLALL